MRKNLILNIAYALLLARWRQTLVAAIGVMFSITMFITLLGFMTGLNDMLDGLILNRTPHIRLYHDVKADSNQAVYRVFPDDYAMIRSLKPGSEGLQIRNAAAIVQALKKDERVLGVAPKVSAQVFYNVGTVDLTGVINGIDVEAEQKLFHFSDYVPAGNFMDLKTVPNSIILGKAAADKMLAAVGDVIQVTTPRGERHSLKVVGLFQSGLQDLDKVQSYASVPTTQKLLGQSSGYLTDINIKLKQLELAPGIAKEYARLFETDAEDIQTANAQFETGSDVRSIISYAVGITLLIVAGFGIYNILNMLIYEKMDSIAILKATGFSGRDVKNIFKTIAVSIGLAGGLTGLLFGNILSHVVDTIPFNTAALPTIKTFPVNYNPKHYLIGITFSLLTTYLAGLFPARKASKIDPVQIIRGK
ncbi:MAG TPA: ABC transporter permease [Chitinophagaceae bacterium]|nr:ABC transporter permease [Chitinophagaceae bacterium]